MHDWRRLRTSTSVAIAAMVVASLSVGVSGAASCPGRRIEGTRRADTLRGTCGPDVIYGYGGNDKILGRGGKDRIFGGPGADRIFGGAGADRIFGGGGDDYLSGGRGADQMSGATGADTLLGQAGNDLIMGGSGADFLSGGSGQDVLGGGTGDDGLLGDTGNDTISGGAGLNQLFGGEGHDRLTGGPDSDLLIGEAGDDQLVAGAGVNLLEGDAGDDLLFGGTDPAGLDIVSYAFAFQGVVVDLAAGSAMGDGTDSLSNIEAVFGTPFDDSITGDASPLNVYFGGDGNDQFQGGPGFDYIQGDAGDDAIDGGPDGDFAGYFSTANAVDVDLGTGIATGDGTDTLSNIEAVDASTYDDTLTGGPGNDAFLGNAGNDVITGGGGFDAAWYLFAPSGVTVDLSAGAATGGDGDDSLTGISDVLGSDFDDSISGSDLENFLYGYLGSDAISGASGDDLLVGGDGFGTPDPGTDTLDGGPDTDVCTEGETYMNCETIVAAVSASERIRSAVVPGRAAVRAMLHMIRPHARPATRAWGVDESVPGRP
jgi:Ca2+-binding RTX toxin-like protein